MIYVEKPKLKKPIVSLMLMALLFLSSHANSQVNSDTHDAQKKKEMARMHTEAIGMNETHILNDFYHKDVILYKFPAEELANGKEAAIAYLKKEAEGKEPGPIEIPDVVEVDEMFFVKYISMDPVLHTPIKKAAILEFKDGRIIKVYFF